MGNNNYFAKNISYLLDNNIVSTSTLLKITKHNSPGLISMWKSGERNIMPDDAIAIANFLNITMDDLFNKDLLNFNENRITIDSVKKMINQLDNKDMNKNNKESLIDMVDFYHEKTIKEEKELIRE